MTPNTVANPAAEAGLHPNPAYLRMRRFADFLLFIMTAVFLVTEFLSERYPLLHYIRAFSEAAMVGAIADWFAVTALFRHPFGLPIPHTAIIPRKKDRIGESLGNFIRDNFIKQDALESKLRNLELERRLSEWLSVPGNSQIITEQISLLIPGLLNTLDDKEFRIFIEENIKLKVKGEDVAAVAGKIISMLATKDREKKIFDEILRIAEHLVNQNRDWLREKIRKETPWFVPSFVGNQVYQKIVTQAESSFDEIEKDPNHPYRRQFTDAIQQFIQDLYTSEEFHNRIEEIKTDLLKSPAVQEYLTRVWQDIKQYLLQNISKPDSALRQQIQESIYTFLNKLVEDEAIRQKLSNWVLSGAINTISRYRNEIGGFIAGTIKNWDARVLSTKLENQVGKDLQYIRINGTIVGGTVGLVLYLVQQLI